MGGEKGFHSITGLGELRQGRGNKSVCKIGVWFCFAIFFFSLVKHSGTHSSLLFLLLSSVK